MNFSVILSVLGLYYIVWSCCLFVYIFLAKHCLLLVDLILSKSSKGYTVSACVSRNSGLIVHMVLVFDLLIIGWPSFTGSNFSFFIRKSTLITRSRSTTNFSHVFVEGAWTILPIKSVHLSTMTFNLTCIALDIVCLRYMCCHMFLRRHLDFDAFTSHQTEWLSLFVSTRLILSIVVLKSLLDIYHLQDVLAFDVIGWWMSSMILLQTSGHPNVTRWFYILLLNCAIAWLL